MTEQVPQAQAPQSRRPTQAGRRSLADRLADHPFLAREVLGRSRSWAMPVTMALFVTGLGGFALVLFAIVTSGAPGGQPAPDDMANVAFLTAALQLTLFVLVVPALVGPAVAGERERATFDLLLLGNRSVRRLVMAQLTASLAFVALLVTVALPVLVAAFLYAGLDLGDVLLVEMVTLVTALALGSVALAISAWRPRALGATLAAYAALLGMYVATAAVGILLTNRLASPEVAHPFVFANPFYALHALAFGDGAGEATFGQLVRLLVLNRGGGGGIGPSLSPWQASVLSQLVVAGIGVLAAAELVAGRQLATRSLRGLRGRPAAFRLAASPPPAKPSPPATPSPE